MKHSKAGYITDYIGSTIINHFDKENIFLDSKLNSPEINKLRGLLQSISTFEAEFPQSKEIYYDNINPVLVA
jgi:hypothetical protein